MRRGESVASLVHPDRLFDVVGRKRISECEFSISFLLRDIRRVVVETWMWIATSSRFDCAVHGVVRDVFVECSGRRTDEEGALVAVLARHCVMSYVWSQRERKRERERVWQAVVSVVRLSPSSLS